ncbi:MAG: chorismate synthase [Lachnospiraceae bacterium]|nr:chorismate synthase [Lachnospiraceae bacterium]
MAGSSFGTIFRITTWGESHGPALGVVVDGCPAGLSLCEEDFLPMMNRRRPNGGAMSTKRNEADAVEILSGTFEGKTTGTPISLLIRNTDQHSKDYGNLASVYRPGHADFGFSTKYGIRDYRGGGRSSGRETAARVAAGVIAEKILQELGVTFSTVVTSIGGHPFEEAGDYVAACRAEGDSCGSEVVCTVSGMPAGIGDPVFEKLDANLAKAIMSIGAVKALDIGDGRDVVKMKGSENNDAFRMNGDTPETVTNHCGGILGGMSTGGDIVLRVSFKPTPSISSSQQTVSADGEDTEIAIHGRHDPVIGPRAAVVVEAMTAIVLLDSLLLNMPARLSSVTEFYNA